MGERLSPFLAANLFIGPLELVASPGPYHSGHRAPPALPPASPPYLTYLTLTSLPHPTSPTYLTYLTYPTPASTLPGAHGV